MAPIEAQQPGSDGWARKVNSRWIVHHGLREAAESYLNHLEANDPERLAASCERANRLVHACEAGEDPKPWFYAGLFSLATVDEASHFLAEHWFTTACIPSLFGRVEGRAMLQSIGSETQSKIERVRAALSKLL
jgi:hypothetical protein